MSDQPQPPSRIERRMSSPEHRAAYQRAKDAPAAHKPKLVTTRSVAQQVHGAGVIGIFNTWLAVGVTRSVGTMWAAYVFSVIGIASLVGAFTNNVKLALIAGGISSYFLQLVLLPIIIVGQNVISEAQDGRAEADHLTLTTLHAINVQQLKMLEQQGEMLRQQREILDLLQQKGISIPASGSGA